MPDNFTQNMIVTKDLTVTIATDDQLTNALDLRGKVLVGLHFPTMTSTAITFTACDTADGTYKAMYDADGTAISMTIASSYHTAIAPEDFASVQFLKIATGSEEVADRTITAVMRAV